MKPNQTEYWPKYLPYTPVSMGMIQPEWLFMSHFFEEPEDGMEEEEPPPPHNSHEIRINIRPRNPD